MAASAWTPVDETASAWTPVDESALQPVTMNNPRGGFSGILPASTREPALGMYGGPTGEKRLNPTIGQTAGDLGVAAATGAGIGGAALAAPTIGPPLAGAAGNLGAKALAAIPYIAASEGIGYLRQNIPSIGKYIPSAAEMLPFFMMGGGEKTQAKMPQTQQEMQELLSKRAAEAPSTENLTPVQIGKFAKETGNPYAFKNTPPMNLVDSTNITKTGYHPDSKTMVMEFRNGKVYEYRGVPQQIYDQFQKSESAGSFFARQIKGRYETNYRGSVLGKK